MDGVERGMCEEDEVACQRCGWESSDEEEEGEEGEKREDEDGDEEEREEMGLRLAFEQQRRQRQWVGMVEAERQCRDAMEVEELVGVIEKWREGCQWCVASGRDGRGHVWEECEDEGGQEGLKGLKMLQDNWQIVPYSCCYGCWLPQAVCESFGFDMQKGGYRKQREVGC
ncbi:hypothetical protein yc1106_06642 [Curvularia clavata]|uniref:Uncharacterized protein n=1 Tax=Curvularia clavata TaxID=95742 RepID=A0A9Q8ZFQ9_CURCL|nr:hypothetical protein yc1106_06642 [Curvularia clavata]